MISKYDKWSPMPAAPFPRPTISGALLSALIAVVLFSGCNPSRQIRFSGKTMGTAYHITVLAPFFTRAEPLQKKVEQRLEQVNQSLSTYIKGSEISRFNAIDEINTPFYPTADFLAMVELGRQLFALTGGAWDGTVLPLIRLWGFDRPDPPTRLPDQAAIDELLNRVGFDQVVTLPDGGIVKKKPGLALDFASIAKGYGVDQLAGLLKENGFENFIVEIGGDLFAAGVRKDNRKWRVGINLPEPGAPRTLIRQAVPLSDQAIAPSGDYRHFFSINGRTYCHILDPRTGYPVTTGVVSASVTAATCAFADGLATALMVMDVQAGLDLVNSLAGTECLITVRDPGGTLRDYFSNHFTIEGEANG